MVSRSCQATATFVSTEPGNVEINTKNQQGLRNTTQRKSVCDSTNVSSFVVSADREQAPADGATPISLYVWFQDSQGKPKHGNQSKFLGIDPTGVGFRLTSTGGEVPIGPSIVSETECSYAESRASDSAGVAAIRFSFRSQSEFKRFYFYPPLSFRVLVWADAVVSDETAALSLPRERDLEKWRHPLDYGVASFASVTACPDVDAPALWSRNVRRSTPAALLFNRPGKVSWKESTSPQPGKGKH